jgi:adenylate kinase
MKIICIAGLIGSGKDEAAKYIEKKYGYFIIDYASILREICKKEGLEVTRDNLQNLRVKYGNTFLAEAAVEKIKSSAKEKIILTPMRRSEDFIIPKDNFGDSLKMIIIDSPARIRFDRLRRRGRENDPRDFGEFKRQEKREFEIFDFGKTFSLADYRVDNSGGRNDLKKNIDRVMMLIEKGGKNMKLIIMGPQGSGKGTHAKKLAEKTGLTHISTGDLLRETIEQGSKESGEIKKLIDAGNLIPDEMMFKILKKRMDAAKSGFVLDGWPRTVKQAEMTDKLAKIDKVLYLNVSDKECLRRLGGRSQCHQCGAIYGNENPPKKKGMCKCGAQLFVRDDDKEEVVKKRLKTYHEQTEPILDFYRKKKMLTEVKIDRILTPEEVFGLVCKALGI